jgi:hypothetical protein
MEVGIELIVTYLGVHDYRRGMDWMNWINWPLAYTTLIYTSQIIDTQTHDYSLLQSPLAASWQQI